MIRIHEFNSEWWGGPVGIVADPAFFSLAPDTQERLLEPYQWAEYRAAAGEHPPLQMICKAGFFHADTQIDFRISLRKLESTPDLDALETRFADESPFVVRATDMKSFAAERFVNLPGATAERVDSRYALWSEKLIAKDPAWCVEVLERGEVQGWCLSTMTRKGLNLTLSMLQRQASIPGLDLYKRALFGYAGRGADVGWASYSASNIPAMNIWASLGALMTGCEHFWLWTGPSG